MLDQLQPILANLQNHKGTHFKEIKMTVIVLNIKGIYPKSDIFSHYLFSLMSFWTKKNSVKHEDILINVF